MSKNLKRVAALVVALSICISMFAMLSAQAYAAKITGWSGGLDSSYTWYADGSVTEAQKEQTRSAVADELAYQNEVLGFKIGTSDKDSTEWAMSTWGGMVAVQVENYDATKTDNTGNPWDSSLRRWGIVTAPFVGTAFTVKADFAKNYPQQGNNPAVSNQFTVGDTTYQVYWNGTTMEKGGVFTSNKNAPGVVSPVGGDITNNKFRYAVTQYNQKNKRAGVDGKGLTVGYPSSWANQPSANNKSNVTFQKFTNATGNAYVAMRADTLKDGLLDGAYVIIGDFAAAFENITADTVADRFVITGAPVANAANGKQEFENGTLSKTGFKSNACAITSFKINGEPAPAVINEAEGTIYAFVSEGTSVNSINPTITHTGVSITPSGAQDFTNEVTYSVTAENGKVKAYKVNVVKLAPTDIMSFVIDGVSADINFVTKTITAVVSGDYDLTKAAPTITTLDPTATLAPASGAATNLFASWTNGVSYKATKGSSSSTYTVRVRNKSKDTSITSFVIPDGQLKYQGKHGAVEGTVNGNIVNLEYEYGNGTSQQTIANVQVAEGATISPDPSVKRIQTKYVVTAEAGNTREYTVKATVNTTDPTFPAVTEEELGIQINFLTGKFSNRSLRDKAKAAVLKEYNNQRAMGIDPGTPVGFLEGWDSVLNRQFFSGGYGCNTRMDLGGTIYSCAIMIDVAGGNAYTLKNTMLSLWQGSAMGDNGQQDWIFAKAGAPAVNEFTMNGKTYQQFASSYAYYDSSSRGVFMHGTGTFSNSQIAGLKTSMYYSPKKDSLDGEVLYSFRQAYERANLFGFNPGIADGGSTSFVTVENGGGLQYVNIGKTDETFRRVTTADSKGIETTVVEEGKFDNFVLYQVFSGSGAIADTNRNASNKTIVIKGTNAMGVDNGGGIALFNSDKYRIKDIYEALPGEKVELTAGGISFKYNRTYGTPTNYLVDKDGNIIMSFIKNTKVIDKVDDEGNLVLDDNGDTIKAFDQEVGYFIAYNGNPNTIDWVKGSYVSNDNTLSQQIGDVLVDDAKAEIKVVNNKDLFPGEDESNKDARAFKEDAIYINYSKDAKVDVAKIQFTKLTPHHELAKIKTPELTDEGAYQLIDCEVAGQLYVSAEDESTRVYSVYIYQDGQSLMMDGIGQEWAYWTKEPVKEKTYPYLDETDGLWVYDYDPNAHLKDEKGNALTINTYGFYKNNVVADENWVIVGIVGQWEKPATLSAWRAYYIENFYGKF